MSEDKASLSGDEKEEQGLLTKVITLAPLLTLILQFLELLFKILGVTK
jgi:hypothetical protein